MADLKEIQKNQHGGARKGAGRPKGSTSKLKVTDFFSGEEREQLIARAKEFVLDAEKPDKEMTKFLWEQLFGKATQRNELTGAEGEALHILFDQAFNQK